MKQFTLYKKHENTPELVKSADMQFENPYEAFEWLRQLSYVFQAAGCRTQINGYELEIHKGGKLLTKYVIDEEGKTLSEKLEDEFKLP